MKRSLIVSVVAMSLMGGAVVAQANVINKKELIKKEIAIQKKNFKSASIDIQKGLSDTLKAIDLLSTNKNKEATKNLNEATKYFNDALKTNPKLGLVPIAHDIAIYQYKGTPNDIKTSVKIAKKMLEKNNLQLARNILDPLRDEIDITTHYIPMSLYPNSTKIAENLLSKGKSKKALQELRIGLSTIVAERVIIPIPLLASRDLVRAASKLGKTKKKEALKLLSEAKMELEKAVLLGYTSDHAKEYKVLNNEISGIQKGIKGKNRVEKLYEKIKKHFKALVNKVRDEKKKV